MKFDIIDALKQARDVVGHECTINCRLSDGAYTIQIKVILPNLYGQDRNRPLVYGQQIAFTNAEVLVNDWYIMNERFQKAIHSLKIQIEG